jgi:hypothetical protein
MGNGTTQYFFNNVSWGLGGGTSNYGIDAQNGAGPNASAFYFYNNTLYSNGGTRTCIDGSGGGGGALTVVLQNNDCITNQNPYWTAVPSATYKNQAGSTSASSIEAASVAQPASRELAEGYAISDLFAPAAATNDTVTFASGSANLTSLCSGYLTPLCSDINGNPRPTTGGWQAGAYVLTGLPSPTPPTDLTATAQ